MSRSNRTPRIESHWFGLDHIPVSEPILLASGVEYADSSALNYIASLLPQSFKPHTMTVESSGCPKGKQATVEGEMDAGLGEKTDAQC